MIKIYEYKACSTCKKALKFLDSCEVEYEKIAIVEQPPSKPELKKMAGYVGRDVWKFHWEIPMWIQNIYIII